MNKLLIVGRLTKDPEAGSTPSEVTYSSLFVAVDKEGREGANFIPVKLWRQQAEFANKYLNKGDLVSIEGSLETSTYEKDGKKITRYEMLGSRINSLTSKKEKEAKGIDTNSTPSPSPAPTPQPQPDPVGANTAGVPWELDL